MRPPVPLRRRLSVMHLYSGRPMQFCSGVDRLLYRGHPEVVDADLADYFGSIPHAELLKSVARRIVDRRVLHLIKVWLECPVEETDDRGRKKRTTEARDKRRGIPQGSPITPLTQKVTCVAWRLATSGARGRSTAVS